MFGLIIDAAKGLMDAGTALHQLGSERRARLATYFDNISKVLQDFVDMTRQGKQSAGPCAELAQYAEAIREVASPTLPGDRVEALAEQLAHVCRNWQQLAPTGEPGGHAYDAHLSELEAGAGAFRGLANVMRAR
jgi:hypothetical protein